MQNKILNRYLLPSYISTLVFLIVASSAGNFMAKEATLAKKHVTSKSSAKDLYSTYLLCTLVIIVSLAMAGFCSVGMTKDARKKEKALTQHYLQWVFAKHPEVNQYRSILEDPKRLREMAALICNGLSKEERKQILDIINKPEDFENFANKAANIAKVEYAIVDVVKKHAAANPEYMQSILNAIRQGQTPIVMASKEKVR